MFMEKLPPQYLTPLYRHAIYSDDQLVELDYQALLKIRNIGHVAIEQINQKVRIPMGLKPLERPTPQVIHPNRKAGIDKYWERYRRGEVSLSRYRRNRV